MLTEYFPSSKNIDVRGGVEMRAFYIAKHLSRNHNVTVFATKEKNKPRQQKIDNILIYRLGLERNYSRLENLIPRLIFIARAIQKGFELDFDLIEGSSYIGWLPTVILSRIKNKPSILLVADLINAYATDLPTFVFKPAWLLEKLILFYSNAQLICISKQVKKKVESLGISSKRIKVIYCGVDVEKIKKITTQNKIYTLCSIARLVPYKRVADLIKAITLLKEDFPRINCVIIGDGEMMKPLKELTKKGKLTKQIFFKGFLKKYENLIRILKQTKIFCLPSIVEGFGIATIEALVTGTPAVIADIPINHEITQNKGVLFFKPCNPVDLARKISLLLQKSARYAALCQQTGNISLRYNWQKIADETEKFYAYLCTH